MSTRTFPRRWLVFGASGAVGRFLLPALESAGTDVLAVSREARAAAASSIQWLQGALQGAPALDALLAKDWPFDVLCSLGPLDAFVEWLEAHPPPVGLRVLALSSMSAEWKQASANPAERALALALVSNEQRLLRLAEAAGAAATVLRCGLIHGAGIDRSLSPLLRWARRWPLPWPRAAGGRRQPVHAADLARAVTAAAVRPELAQQRLSLPGPEALTFRCMLQRSLDASGLSGRLIPVPTPGLPPLLRWLASGDSRYSAAAAMLARLYVDQLGSSDDWARLGIPLDELRRIGDHGAAISSTAKDRNCQW